MTKEKKIFLSLVILTIVSFLLCGYSLISCLAFSGNEEELGSHILEISYLFMHLILCAIIVYLSFRAMKFGSFFVKNVVFDANGYPSKGRRILFIVLGSLFFLLFIYSFIQAVWMRLPLASEIGLVVWHDIMNGSFLALCIFIIFLIYPIVPYKKDNKHAE